MKYDGYNLKKGGAQYLHLAADQALAFVRDRDSLPDTDLSRTHRQQAVIDYVIWKLKNEGVLQRPRPAHRPAQHRRSVHHHRLGLEPARLLHPDARAERREPEVLHRPDHRLRDHRRPGRQRDQHPRRPGADQGEVHRARAGVRRASAQPASEKKAAAIPAASTVTVDVYNGGPTPGLAGRSPRRWSRTATRPAPSATRPRSRRPSRPAPRCSTARARRPTRRRSRATSARPPRALASLPAGHVEILLGTGSTVRAGRLAPATSSTSSASPSASSSSTSTSDNGQAGGAVTVGANAKYGIPCVY